MNQFFKRIDELTFSIYIVILSALIFMRYSQDLVFSKALIQSGLFQYLLPGLGLYFSLKLCVGVAQMLIQFENNTHDYSEPLSNLFLYGAALYFMAFLFSHPDVSSHISIQVLFVIPALLSFSFLVIKGRSLDKNPNTILSNWGTK